LDHAKKNSKKKVLDNNEWISTDLLLAKGGFGYFAVSSEQSNKRFGVEFE
jgi:hypothetical protein